MSPDGAVHRLRFYPWLLLAFIVCVAPFSRLVAAETDKRYFQINAGDAAETLKQFSVQAQREIMFPADSVTGVRTEAVRGRLFPREALQRLIARTDLTIIEDAPSGAFIVKRGPLPVAANSSSSSRPTSADPNPTMKPKTLLAVLGGLFMAAAPGSAQSGATGTVTGRIFNPATGEYVRNAQVRVEETGQSTVSEGGGEYRLPAIPAGKATVTVNYTGYRPATASVTVGADATVSQDFNLISTLQAESTFAGGTIQLQAFTVSTEREGAAKAIMDQRNSMNLTNTVASDTFGENAEGNLGEFLKHLPGVELDQFYGEARSVRLGGLGSEYTSVTMDGVALASVDANNSGSGAARSFTMEMASLNSMESIEVNKTISADVDANAPAGTINLRTKRAFDRAGRHVWWQATIAAHSEAFNLKNSQGPDELETSRKIRPGGILEYSDVFLNKRLGVVLNLSESNVYQEALITATTFNATPTAADPRPLVITTLNLQHAPRFNKRFATTLTTDYKFSNGFNVGLSLVYNYVDLWTPQRIFIVNTGARNTVIGADPLTSFTSTTVGNVQVNPVAVSKFGETFTVLPRFAYKYGSFELEGKFAFSDSTSWYDPLDRRNSVRDTNTPTASGVAMRAERSSPMSASWKFTQVGGPDIANGASFTSPAPTTNDGRFGRTTFYSAEVNAMLKTQRVLPIQWKTGVKIREQDQKFEDDQLARRYDYAPNGGAAVTTGAWANYRSPWGYDLGMIDGSVTSISGANVFMPNLRAIGDLYRDRPQDFRQNWGTNSDNYYESFVARRRRFNEQISAAFLMGTTSWKKFTGRLGLRWEETQTDATESNSRSIGEVRAAGFLVNTATGRATTIPGLDYQFLSRPRIHRTGDYDNLFPSASLKYRMLRNFDLHFGYSSTIRRPSYVDLAGVRLINENTLTVTTPNVALKPETSENYATRLAYYFEPVGQLAVTFAQRSVQDLIIEQRISAEEFGYTGDDELASYEFLTKYNSPGRIKIRSMEWEYSQNLGILGAKFKRLSGRVSYTRIYAEIPRTFLTPHLVSGGLYYTLGRVSVNANWNWADDMPVNIGNRQYRRHRSNLDAGGSVRLTKTYVLSLNARNITNTPYIEMRSFGTNSPVMVRHEIVGTSWTLAVKGTY